MKKNCGWCQWSLEGNNECNCVCGALNGRDKEVVLGVIWYAFCLTCIAYFDNRGRQTVCVFLFCHSSFLKKLIAEVVVGWVYRRDVRGLLHLKLGFLSFDGRNTNKMSQFLST